MRVVKPSRIRAMAQNYPLAAESLMAWLKIVRVADWKNLHQVRETYPGADGVVVGSGRVVTVFNIGGNKYRLLVAIHYQWSMVYVLRFITHVEYDKNKWKAEL